MAVAAWRTGDELVGQSEFCGHTLGGLAVGAHLNGVLALVVGLLLVLHVPVPQLAHRQVDGEMGGRAGLDLLLVKAAQPFGGAVVDGGDGTT